MVIRLTFKLLQMGVEKGNFFFSWHWLWSFTNEKGLKREIELNMKWY